MDATTSEMGRIAAAVSNVAATLHELGALSESVWRISEAIGGVAGQTNLRALNATIARSSRRSVR